MWEKILFTTSTGKTRKAIYLKQWRYPHCHVVCLRSRDWFNWCYCCSESQKVQPQRVEIQTWEENFFSNDCVYCNYSDLCYANSNSQCVTVSLGLWYQCVMSLIYNWKVVQKQKVTNGLFQCSCWGFLKSFFCALSSVWWSSWLDFHNIKPTTHLGQIIDDRLT